MYEWTLAAIRTLVRDVTGYKSTNQMADATVDGWINQFYQNELPRLLGHSEFHSWFTFNTADGDLGKYVIDTLATNDGANIIGFDDSYVTVAGVDVSVYYDRALFFSLWPEDVTHEEAQPTDVLFEGRNIWLRPPPDAIYEVSIPVTRKCPAALTAIVNPLDPSWGPLIAYGAAVGILASKARDITYVAGMRDYHLALARADETHTRKNQRSAPGF